MSIVYLSIHLGHTSSHGLLSLEQIVHDKNSNFHYRPIHMYTYTCTPNTYAVIRITNMPEPIHNACMLARMHLHTYIIYVNIYNTLLYVCLSCYLGVKTSGGEYLIDSITICVSKFVFLNLLQTIEVE